LSLRPEAISIEPSGHLADDGRNRLKGRLENVKFLGSIVRQVVRIGPREVFADEFNDPRLVLPSLGSDVLLSFQPEACSLSLPEMAPVPILAEEED
jgi:putative spermidine/putrescine transport system ATP-binding protein